MEAASVPAAPAAADADGQVQAPGTDALGAEQAQVPAAPETTPDSPEADVRAQLEALKAEVETLRGKQPQQGEPDLLSALEGSEEDLGFTPEELATLQAGQNPDQTGAEQQQAQLAELDAYMKEKIDEAVNPILEQRNVEKVQAWQKEHSDVTPGTPLFDQIVASMQNLAERYGDQASMDVDLLDQVYTAAKAKAADAGAVPAEQAGANGASLETGAGQTQPGEDSEAAKYRQLLTGAGSNPLA